jgi:ankyrin repeat protein
MNNKILINNYEFKTFKIKYLLLIAFLIFSIFILNSCSDANKKLFDAIEDNDIETVKELIKQGMDLNIINEEGKPAIILAVELKRRRIAEIMLDTDNINVDVRDETGTSLFMWICKNVELDLFERVINKGVQINDANEDGMTPIMFAAQSGYIDAIMTLIKRKAYMNAQNKDGNTPLMLALKNGIESTTRLLRDNKSILDMRNNNGETPLIIAAENGMVESVHLLLEYKADKTIKNNKGRTALSLAQEKGYKKIIELLSKENPK